MRQRIVETQRSTIYREVEIGKQEQKRFKKFSGSKSYCLCQPLPGYSRARAITSLSPKFKNEGENSVNSQWKLLLQKPKKTRNAHCPKKHQSSRSQDAARCRQSLTKIQQFEQFQHKLKEEKSLLEIVGDIEGRRCEMSQPTKKAKLCRKQNLVKSNSTLAPEQPVAFMKQKQNEKIEALGMASQKMKAKYVEPPPDTQQVGSAPKIAISTASNCFFFTTNHETLKIENIANFIRAKKKMKSTLDRVGEFKRQQKKYDHSKDGLCGMASCRMRFCNKKLNKCLEADAGAVGCLDKNRDVCRSKGKGKGKNGQSKDDIQGWEVNSKDDDWSVFKGSEPMDAELSHF